MTDERLADLEWVSRLRREQTLPENGPAIAIECDTLDALITALRAERQRADAAEGEHQALLDIAAAVVNRERDTFPDEPSLTDTEIVDAVIEAFDRHLADDVTLWLVENTREAE